MHHHCTENLTRALRVLCREGYHVACLKSNDRAGYYCSPGLYHQQVCHGIPCCSREAVLRAKEVMTRLLMGSTLGGVTILICTRRSSRATMGWKQSGHGEALRRFSPPWFMRCARMEGKAKTWPQGVICGHTGASREMGHWISCAVNISTCTPGSRVRSAKNRIRCFLRLGTCAHCHAWCRTWQQVLRLALRGCTHDTCKVMPAQADHSSLSSLHVVLLLWTEIMALPLVINGCIPASV